MKTQEYRAYIKAENKMYRVIALHAKLKDEKFNRIYLDRPTGKDGIANYQVDGENVILRQHIGLTDNTDKKYFEGHIFEFDNGDRGYIDCDRGKFFANTIGDWECEDQIRDWYRVGNAKIIGNIYQNKKLLTEDINKWYDVNFYTGNDMEEGEHHARATTHIYAKSMKEALKIVKKGYIEIINGNEVCLSDLKNNKFKKDE